MTTEKVESKELPTVKLSKDAPSGTFPGTVDDTHVIGVTKKTHINIDVLKTDYSPCPFGFKELKKLVKLVSALEQYTNDEDGFEILVPTSKQGPLIIESKATGQLYMIAPRYRPYLQERTL